MKSETNNKIVYWILALLLIGSIIGCSGTGTTDNDDDTYQVAGIYVQNLNRPFSVDYSYLAMEVLKNDNGQSSVTGTFDGSALAFGADSVYSLAFWPTPLLATGNYYLGLDDSTYADSFVVSIPDSVYIMSYNPDSTTTYNANNNNIVISWSGATGTDGYVIAVVKATDAYTGVGYSELVTTLATSGTITPDAFRDQFDNLVTGRYNIYIYSYTGSPDADLSVDLLPVPFPTQLADNVSQGNTTGHFGTVVVCRRVIIDVVT